MMNQKESKVNSNEIDKLIGVRERQLSLVKEWNSRLIQNVGKQEVAD